MDRGHNDEGRALAAEAVRTGKPLTHAFLIDHYFNGDVEAFNHSRRWLDEWNHYERHYWDGVIDQRKRERRRYVKRFDTVNLRKCTAKRLHHPRRPALFDTWGGAYD